MTEQQHIEMLATIGAGLAVGWRELLAATIEEMASQGVDRGASLIGLRMAVEMVALGVDGDTAARMGGAVMVEVAGNA